VKFATLWVLNEFFLAVVDRMARLSEAQIAAFNADFVKIFASALGVGMVIFGYSYSNAFFKSFGISLFQLEMEWIDILFRGTALVQDWRVAGLFLLLILCGSAIFSLRNLVGASWQVLLVSLSVFGVVMSATWGGQALGYSHAKSIWADGAGKLAFCTLDAAKHPELDGLAQALTTQAREQRLRLILRTKDNVYLAPVVEKVHPNQRTGEAYVIPVSAISFCRIVGS